MLSPTSGPIGNLLQKRFSVIPVCCLGEIACYSWEDISTEEEFKVLI
jgi:hypothetical protein